MSRLEAFRLRLLERIMLLAAAPMLWFARRPLRLIARPEFRGVVASLRVAGRQIVLASTPAAAEHVLLRKPARYAKSRIVRALLEPLIGGGLFASVDDAVPVIRRIFIRAIARVDDRAIAATTAKLVEEYAARWAREGALAALPASEEMSRLTIDVVAECLFRVRFEEAQSLRFTRLFADYQWAAPPLRTLLAGERLGLSPLMLLRRRRIGAAMRDMMRATFVDAVRTPGSPAAAAPFAAALREAAGGADPVTLDDDRLVDEAAVMLLAGHETSASVLSWFWSILALDRDLQARLRAEDAGRAPDDPGPLLLAALNETMRLYPPIPFYARDAAEDDGALDEPVRARAYLIVSPWIMQRDGRTWGADAGRFRPERFLDPGPPRHPSAFMPFGLGPRACPGGRFAMTEMQVIAREILRRFDVSLVSGGNAEAIGNLTTRPDREIFVRLAPRRA